MEIGAIFTGKVTGITKYGCFVAFDENKSGMVHISEVSNTFVNEINEAVTIGQQVKVKIIKIDENGRINLSIKKADQIKQKEQVKHYTPKKKNINMEELTFEEKMKLFMSNSQDRLTDVKHNTEKKNGSKRKR